MAKQVKKQKSMEEALWEWYHLLFGYDLDFTRCDSTSSKSKLVTITNTSIDTHRKNFSEGDKHRQLLNFINNLNKNQ